MPKEYDQDRELIKKFIREKGMSTLLLCMIETLKKDYPVIDTRKDDYLIKLKANLERTYSEYMRRNDSEEFSWQR